LLYGCCIGVVNLTFSIYKFRQPNYNRFSANPNTSKDLTINFLFYFIKETNKGDVRADRYR